MDDVIVRQRQNKYGSIHAKKKRRKNSANRNESFAKSLMVRTLTSLVLLIIFASTRYINIPATDFITQQVKYMLNKNVDLKSGYKSIDNSIEKIKNSTFVSKIFGEDEEKSIPAIGGYTSIVDNGGTIDYSIYYSNVGETQSNNKEIDSADDTKKNEDQTNKIVEEVKSRYNFVLPIVGELTSPFGERIHPLQNTDKFHKGIDIKANNGSSIKAVLSGSVIVSGIDSTYGKYVKIDHGDGLVTLYAHCSSLNVNKGQKVKQGNVIAKVGSTGASNGPHLHFEVLKDGKALDPLKFIKLNAK